MNSIFSSVSSTDFMQFLSLIITCITAIVLVKTYKRNRKIELENHLYKLKMESYSGIIYEFEKIFSQFAILISTLKRTKDSSAITEVDFNKIANELDLTIYHSDAVIKKQSVYFSEHTLETLLEFSNKLYGEAKGDLSLEEGLSQLNGYYEKQLNIANEANIRMRKDLGISDLNKSLFKRYSKTL